MKPLLLAILLFSFTPFIASAQIDNTGSIPMQSGSTGLFADGRYSFEGFKDAIANTKTEGASGFLSYFLTDPPLGFEEYLTEYRQNNGGPVSNFFGISAFKLQNVFVKAFTGMMLLIFVGGAVVSGLQKEGVNFVQIGLKFMLGLIFIFHPDYIYATARCIQSGGVVLIQAVANGLGDSFKKGLEKSDILANSYNNVIRDAIVEQQGKLSSYVPQGTASQVYPMLQAYNQSLANVSPSLPPVPLPNPSGTSGEDAILAGSSKKTAWSNFPEAVGNNKEFQTKTQAMIAEYIKRIASGEDPTVVQAAFKAQVEMAASEQGQKTYGISVPEGFAADINAKVKNMMGWVNGLAQWSCTYIGSFLIPAIAWVILRLSQFFLEMTVVLTVITYPLWFLESTCRAFKGTWNGLITAALMPVVAMLCLSVFEGVMSQLYSVIQHSPMMFLPFQIVYLCIWIVGVIVILCKCPKLTKSVIEGTSPVGTIMAGMLTAGIGGVLAGVGIPMLAGGAAVAGAGALAAGGGAAASGAGSAASGAGALASGATQALAAGSSAGTAAAGAPAMVGGGSQVLAPAQMAGASQSALGATRQQAAAANIESQLAAKSRATSPPPVPDVGGSPSPSSMSLPSGGSGGGSTPVADAPVPTGTQAAQTTKKPQTLMQRLRATGEAGAQLSQTAAKVVHGTHNAVDNYHQEGRLI